MSKCIGERVGECRMNFWMFRVSELKNLDVFFKQVVIEGVNIFFFLDRFFRRKKEDNR